MKFMIKIIITILMSLFFFGCTHNPYPYIDIIDKITERKASQICREEKLKVVATGGAMMDSITRFTICFASYGKELDLAEARRLYVKCMEGLRNEINSHEELKPFLNPNPFPVDGMDIGFMIFDKQGHFMRFGCAFLGKGGISAISQHYGTIFYDSYNPRTEKLESFYEEPYEVALAIVRGETRTKNRMFCCFEIALE